MPVLEEGRDVCSLLLLPAIEHVEELDEVGAFALGEELPIAGVDDLDDFVEPLAPEVTQLL